MLSSEDREHYDSQGYCAPFQAYQGAEVKQIRAVMDRLVGELGDRDAYAINCYQARVQSLWDICSHPPILDAVEGILGPNIICWASHLFNKQAGDTRSVPWHQDAVFWSFAPQNTVTVWLAIDDADAANSALEFIPGSHTEILQWESNAGQDVLDRQVVGAEQYGSGVVNELKAGQFSLHHDLLLHGSKPNRSDRRRCGFTIRYCSPDVRATDVEWGRGIEAIVVRGQDDSGYWTHHPRPEGDTIVGVNGPRSVGGN